LRLMTHPGVGPIPVGCLALTIRCLAGQLTSDDVPGRCSVEVCVYVKLTGNARSALLPKRASQGAGHTEA